MNSSINFAIGTSIQVSADDNKFKYSTLLLGADPGKTLISRLPSTKQLPNENVIYDNLFYPGRTLIFRLISDGVIYAFKTNVQACHHKPCQLLFTEYPREVQSRIIRKEFRYPSTLPCQLQEFGLEGLVTNISGSGCQVTLAKSVDQEKIDALRQWQEDLTITIKFPFSDDEQPLQSAIKSFEQREQQYKLGLSFSLPTNMAEQYVNALHLQEIAEFI